MAKITYLNPEDDRRTSVDAVLPAMVDILGEAQGRCLLDINAPAALAKRILKIIDQYNERLAS